LSGEVPRDDFLPYAGMTRIRFEGSQRCRLFADLLVSAPSGAPLGNWNSTNAGAPRRSILFVVHPGVSLSRRDGAGVEGKRSGFPNRKMVDAGGGSQQRRRAAARGLLKSKSRLQVGKGRGGANSLSSESMLQKCGCFRSLVTPPPSSPLPLCRSPRRPVSRSRTHRPDSSRSCRSSRDRCGCHSRG
jgi:hypothetical protein